MEILFIFRIQVQDSGSELLSYYLLYTAGTLNTLPLEKILQKKDLLFQRKNWKK